MRVLSLNAGRVSTYDLLMRKVWGGREMNDTELVRNFVKTLRRKLGDDAARPVYILTERGVGYRMVDPGGVVPV
ncbi:MAG: helix-turn-helix domain-containing protein [Spirochaetaceae bacterium]|nr:helix-turn-helix domain-containing protein [Spirochaetaceae bacterium]